MDFFHIFILLFFLIIVVSVVKIIKESKGTGVSLHLSGSMEERSGKVLNSYTPYIIGINDLVKNLAALKLSEAFVRMPTSNQISFGMYPLLSWNRDYDYNNSFLKCYAVTKTKKLELQLTYRNVTQDLAIKISEGIIESKFDGTKMVIRLNGRVIGSFDFENHKIFNTLNVEVGKFTIPDASKLRTSLMFDVQALNQESAYEFMSEIFMYSKKITNIILQPTTFESVETMRNRDRETDFPLFNELDIQSSEDSMLILGFGISLLALLENTRLQRGEE